MEFFSFTFQLFDVLLSWVNQLFGLITYEIEFNGETYPLWAILGVSGIAIFVLIKIIRSII